MKATTIPTLVHALAIIALTISALGLLTMLDRDQPRPEEIALSGLILLLFLAINGVVLFVIGIWEEEAVFVEESRARVALLLTSRYKVGK